ncbi:hypothetical protein [Longispora albida]|uniref:hypothetical protein n=1 Tax=Longispora albida TaxID=203523 RepID=UPI0012FC1181|nr:hypothetical protein [Longispora albida]
MFGDREVRVPIGPDAHRWETVAGTRKVLGLVRTFTSTTRLLEALDAFRGDWRVQVVFAVDETSAFHSGVADLLHSAGARIAPWEQLEHLTFDLAVTASENVDLTHVSAPVVLLPHGVGFHKQVPDSRSGVTRVSGLARPEFRERVLHVLSHPGQVAQIARTGGRSVVAGDPAWERILLSQPMREQYRRAFGVTSAGQRLVLLSSTWRAESLLARRPLLAERLLRELPADEFQVALVLHPNAWFGHSPWQIRQWLAPALDLGLHLVPPHEGWQAALVASDVVIGDHGSVTYYAGALGTPILLAEFGAEVVPGTPAEQLGQLGTRLTDAAPAAQIADAVPVPGLASLAFDAPVSLAEVLYEQLGLTCPEPSRRAWPVPAPEHRPVRTFTVRDGVRYPGLSGEGLVCAEESEPDQRLLHTASVIAGADPAGLLSRYPCSWAVRPVPGGCEIHPRDGEPFTVAGAEDPMVLAYRAISR